MPVATVHDLEKLAPVFRGKAGNALLRMLMRVTGISKVNDLYDRVAPLQGPAFADGILKDVGIDYGIGYAERLRELPEGPFITVSNHIYGHLDGIMLVDLFGHQRSGYKVMVNEITIELGNGIGRKCIVAVDMHYIFTTRGTKARATSLGKSGICLVHHHNALVL